MSNKYIIIQRACMFLAALLFSTTLFIFWNIKKIDKYVHITFCDVGQGDAILIYQDFFQVLIDSGPDDRVLTCLSENLPFWDRTLELVVITHYDADHIGGMERVLAKYHVQTILAPTDYKDTDMYRSLQTAIEFEIDNGAVYKKPVFGDLMSFDPGGSFLVLSPWFLEAEDLSQENGGDMPMDLESDGGDGGEDAVGDTYDGVSNEGYLNSNEGNMEAKEDKNIKFKGVNKSNLAEILLWDKSEENEGKNKSDVESTNDRSIVLLYTYKDLSLLLTGDMEHKSEEALLSTGLINPVSLLKVGHHGAKTSSSEVFISGLRPEVSVIQSGKSNSFGHPHDETIETLSLFGSTVLRTDQQGTIQFITDGHYYWLKND